MYLKECYSAICAMCETEFDKIDWDITTNYSKTNSVLHSPEALFCSNCLDKLEEFFDNASSAKEQIHNAIRRAKKDYGDYFFEEILLMQGLEPKDNADVLRFIDWYLLALEMKAGMVIFTGNELISMGEFPTYHLM